jgi:hypothetical protein
MVARSSAMNKIVREHYPVERLPADLRPELPLGASVTVTVTANEEMPRPLTSREAVALIAQMRARNSGKGVTPEEAAAEIRQLRDEWDE